MEGDTMLERLKEGNRRYIRTADAAKTAADNTKKIDMAAQAAKGMPAKI